MDNLDFMNDFINNSSYVWVPIVIFVVLVLTAGLVGFWNGWKTSLYFFGWNLVGVIVGVLVTSPIMKAFDSIGILNVLSSTAEVMWGLLILFVFMLCVNLFAFIFYFIFRKKLKKSIKDNKKAGKSNLSSRFIGAGIAIVSVSPTAVYLADATAVMSPENGFTKFLDALTKSYTGGKYDGSSDDRKVVGNISHVMDLMKAIGGDGSIDLTGEDAKQGIKEIFNTDLVGNVDEIYNAAKSMKIDGKALVDDTQLKGLAVKDIDFDAINVQVPAAKKEQFQNSLIQLFKNAKNSNAEDLAKAIVAKVCA